MLKMRKNIASIPMGGGLYEIFQAALEMEAKGKKIVHMEIGKPDFDSPKFAKDATIQALEDGFVHYTSMTGIPQLRKAIATKEERENGTVFDHNSQIVVTAGACEALTAIFMTMFEEGDEVIIPGPYFSAYADMTQIAGVKLVEVPLTIDDGFELHVEDLRRAVTDKTRGILITTPSNPTGTIIGKEKLQEVADLAKEKDLLVISDETYDQFLFEGKHFSIYNLEGMKERTLIVNSASKLFSMTGWRIGYIIGPSEVMPYLNKVHQNMSTCANSFAQVGAAEAYLHGKEFTQNMVEEFRGRRDLLIQGLRAIPGIECTVPQGAFYLFPRIQNLGISSLDFCKKMLDRGVAMSPGGVFGKAGEGYVRLAYACSREDIQWALEQIAAAVKEL